MIDVDVARRVTFSAIRVTPRDVSGARRIQGVTGMRIIHTLAALPNPQNPAR